jgi:hypothetical protein
MAHVDFSFLIGLSSMEWDLSLLLEGGKDMKGTLLNKTTYARLRSCDIGVGLTDGP